MTNVLNFISRAKENKESNEQIKNNQVINFTPKNKTYAGLIEPNHLFFKDTSFLTKEQSINFYANLIFHSSCSSPKDVLNWAKSDVHFIQQCGKTFLIFHNNDCYTYITLKQEINIQELQAPDYNCKFHENIHENFDLVFDAKSNRFFTWVDLSENDYCSRQLFLMPSQFQKHE